MLPKYLYVVLIQVCCVVIGLADPIPTITIPWVTDGPDFFQGYGGKVLGAKDEATTYAINCLPDAQFCHPFSPDLTVIYAPSTYDLIAQGQRFDLSSGCTLIGSPTATGATCIEITHSHAADFFVSKTVIVPTTGADSSLGIYPAPLPVTDTGNLSVPSTAIKSNPPVDTALRTGHESVAIASDPSPASNDPEINTATGSLVLATSGASASYLNATITAVSVGVPAANETLPVGTTGTMTVTMTVLASNIACHCACDSRSALSQSPMPSTSLVAKNYATKPTMPVAMVGGLVAGFMLLN